MKKIAIAAALAASLSLSAAPAVAATERVATPVAEGESLAGAGNIVWLLITVAGVVGLLALTGGEDTSTPVSP